MGDVTPPPLSDTYASRVRRWAPWIVAAGEFLDGYDLLVIGAAILFLRPTFNLSAGQTGLVSAISFIGAAVGVIIAGDAADRIGRRAVFIFNLLFFVVAAILSALCTNVPELVAMRFFVGFGVGLDIPTSTAFLAEIASAKQRGHFAGSFPNIMWLIGAIVSVVLALLISPLAKEETWRWLFGLAAIPAIVVLLTRRWLPESPRWLLTNGRREDAERVARRLGIAMPHVRSASAGLGRYKELFNPVYRRRFLIVALVFTTNCFGGGVSTVAGPLVIKSTGIGTSHALQFSLAGFVVGLIGVVLGMLIIDRVNRFWYGVVTVSGLFLAGQGLAWLGPRSSGALLFFFVCFSFLSWFGPGVLTWVWSSEVFPTRVRALGAGCTQCCCRLALAINVAAVPALLQVVALRAIAIYSVTYLICLVGILLGAAFLNNTGRELETAAAEEAAAEEAG